MEIHKNAIIFQRGQAILSDEKATLQNRSPSIQFKN